MSSVAGGPKSSSRSARSFRVQRRSTTATAAVIATKYNTRVVATTAVEAPVGSATMTSLPPHLLASIDRINAALDVAVAQPPPATGTLCVCQTTEDEWNAFVYSDGQIVRPNLLEWFADCGEIHIIEFASTPHAKYIVELNDQFRERHIKNWLIGYLGATNSQGRRWSPDLSYGPHETTSGSVLPPGVPIFDDFRTIEIEVGVSQPWGMAQGQLDHKAISIWAVMPGVEYVLCVQFDPDLANAEYKLYDA
ncbi:unnamed protein product [Phytophthora fragariaefolia]|uniref:Unnamed protein product n=1 Tax=Phytophthora fragariaefolia TaxID=1490495 RepID=A0A9W6XGV0_9STRA|nr:unnamed protein product [Phytophthora fragariaefolia]